MALVSPSLLAGDFANLERDIHDMESNGCDWVHVDVMDGRFVPNITIGIPVVKALARVSSLPLDVHLMIEEPVRYAAQFANAGAAYVTVHTEADTQENIHAALEEIRKSGAKPGISVKPNTPAQAVIPYLHAVELILVMTVEPGFGGQSFRTDMLPKLREIREMLNRENPTCRLSVDGGINSETAKLCAENGADVMVMGSAYFRAADRKTLTRQVQSMNP